VTKSHETIQNFHAQVLDSCIAVIMGRPLICENHMVQKIPLYFDEVISIHQREQGVLACSPVSHAPTPVLVAQGYDDTCTRCRCLGLIILTSRQNNVDGPIWTRSMDPFDHPHSASPKSPDELLAMYHFMGTPALRDALKAFYRELIDVFDTAVRSLPAKVNAIAIEIDQSKSQSSHSAEK